MRDKGDKPPIDEDELSAEEIRQLWRRRFVRRILTLGLPAVLILGIGIALAVPRIKDWRARQFAERSDALLAEGKLQEAFNNASSALQMRPQMAEAQRAYAAVLLAAGKPQSVEVLRQLVESGRGSADDRLQLLEAALRFGDIALAERESFALMQQGGQTGAALFALARVRIAQQRYDDAMQALRESIDAGGGPEPSILLAKLRFAQNTPESVAAATDLLRPLALRDDKTGLDALMALLASPALRTKEAAGWVESLRSHPMASTEQKLAAASAEIQIEPSSYAEVVRKTIDLHRSGSTEEKAQLARWLNQNREYRAVLDTIPADEATTRSDLFLIRLDAMAGLGDWKGITTLLRGENLPLQTPVIMLYRGRASRETGDAEAAVSFYRRAVIEAAPSPEVMWYVIDYLQRVGEDAVLEQELTRLTENPATARQAFQALVPIVQKRQDAETLFQLYDRMIKKLPAERAVQNDRRYFAALTGRSLDVAGAQELAAAEPQMLAYRITLSFILLKNGQNEAALRVFDGVTLDPAQIQPYQRAVLAAVLGANGRKNEAQQLARNVPGEAVTAKEFELIAPYRE